MDAQQLNSAIAEAYASRWLTGDDIPRDVTVSIESVSYEELRIVGKKKIKPGGKDDGKAVLKFAGKKKQLPLNPLNFAILESIHGKEATGWIGKQITLCRRYGNWFGERGTSAVRIVVPPGTKLSKRVRLMIEDNYGTEQPSA